MAGIFDSETSTGLAEWLAWVSADEQVDGLDSLPAGGFDVAVVGHAGPSLSKDARSVTIDLGMPDSVPDTGSLKAEGEPVDS
jgi:hypothetical protein